ncbi:putative sterol O-acyltransferase 2 [Neolecta irregularis DAH-3]|uniref:Putative sterol O-acyltransferase 2 n=1 Tax=Neolecta irregularis (strain DAH-3) TaxID=1198029 RepID=A0A1U7LQX7_NEOID|nr:putative sterol O-acyltransferase 2 [Neolecta irregularis DAH-3]|eukprot:OLL25065.1 putative sterol O-acyltransferase 2 [Neolecta irregularis DAH-3]
MTTAMHNLKETGKIFGGSLFSLLSDKLLELAVGDGIMVISAGFVVLVQNIVQKGYISWDKTGYILQHFLQLVWLGWWLSWIFMHSWGWTHNVTFVLHTIVLLMKLHSYSFYNGHLSAAESRLRMLYAKVSDAKDASKEDLEEIEILDRELSSPIGELRYPENLSIARWIDYLIVPSLVYALDWPRTERIRWFYVLEKSLATLGSIFLLYIVAEHYMVPVMHTAAQSLVRQENISGILMTVAEGITWLLFPFTLAILLVFYISILNVFAEISRFADRRFYDDWWNSHTWAAFAVKWNRPVHSFLRVHVDLSDLSHIVNFSRACTGCYFQEAEILRFHRPDVSDTINTVTAHQVAA